MSKRRKSEELFAHLKAEGVTVTSEQMDRIKSKIEKLDYVPKVGILGKTGVGKSTLCNALFGKNVAEINHIKACTLEPEEYFIMLSKESQRGMVIIDTPGIGNGEEISRRDKPIYEELLPKLDAILWIVKADDRAYSVEEQFYRDIIVPNFPKIPPIIVAINQVDKVEPTKEWDINACKPGAEQLHNIEVKISQIEKLFGDPRLKRPFISARYKYNLILLVEEIVFRLPEEKLSGSVRDVERKGGSEKRTELIESASTFFNNKVVPTVQILSQFMNFLSEQNRSSEKKEND